jgi:hypothetical protein
LSPLPLLLVQQQVLLLLLLLLPVLHLYSAVPAFVADVMIGVRNSLCCNSVSAMHRSSSLQPTHVALLLRLPVRCSEDLSTSGASQSINHEYVVEVGDDEVYC